MISNPEINALKRRIRELEGILAHNKTRIEERLMAMDGVEGRHFEPDLCVWVDDIQRDFRRNELRWVLEDL